MTGVRGPSPKPAATLPPPAPAAAPAAPTTTAPAAAPTTAPATTAAAPTAAPTTAPAAAPTAQTAQDAATRFNSDPRAAQVASRATSHPLAEGTLDTAGTLGAAPGARPAASDFSVRPNTTPVAAADVTRLRTAGFQDPASGRAVEALNAAPRPVSGRDMANAIASATTGTDARAATAQHTDLRNYVNANRANLSPDAIAQFNAYETTANRSEARRDVGGIPAADRAALNSTMELNTARATVSRDFGVNVRDGNAPWTTEELSRVHESFSGMPPADRTRLQGLDLIRDHAASPESQAEMGTRGTVAGEYSPNTHTTNGVRDRPGSISMFDTAFPAGTTPAARQASTHIITHEAGHAVEGRARDDAMVAWSMANDGRSAANTTLNAASNAQAPDWPAFNNASRTLAAVRPQTDEIRGVLTAENTITTRMSALQSATTPAAVAQAQTALDAAQTARDTALARLPASGPAREAADARVAAGNTLETSTRAVGNARAAFTTQDTATNARLAELRQVATVTVATADGRRASDTNPLITSATRSNELAAYTTARGREAAVSSYGASASPEGYAEAYALYQRDPGFMRDHFPRQYAFFHANHLNPRDVPPPRP